MTFGYGYGIQRRIREIERASPSLPKRKKKRRLGAERPCGPKLVRGRGLKRRRADLWAPVRAVAYLALAAGLGIIVVRLWIVPFLNG